MRGAGARPPRRPNRPGRRPNPTRTRARRSGAGSGRGAHTRELACAAAVAPTGAARTGLPAARAGPSAG